MDYLKQMSAEENVYIICLEGGNLHTLMLYYCDLSHIFTQCHFLYAGWEQYHGRIDDSNLKTSKQ